MMLHGLYNFKISKKENKTTCYHVKPAIKKTCMHYIKKNVYYLKKTSLWN